MTSLRLAISKGDNLSLYGIMRVTKSIQILLTWSNVMKKIIGCLLSAVIACFSVNASDIIVSETNLVLAVKSTVINYANLNVTVTNPPGEAHGNSEYTAEKALFNGKSWAPSSNTSYDGRYLVNVSKYRGDDNTGVWAKVTAPDNFYSGKRIVLKKYRLHRLSFWGNAKWRAPTEWKIYGVRKDDSKVLLAYENLGTDYWTNYDDQNIPEDEENDFYIKAEYADAANEGFHSYKVEFINSHYTSNKEAGKEVSTADALKSYNLGLQELSLFVDIKEPQTHITFSFDCSEESLQFSDDIPFSPYLSTTFNGSKTLSASRRANKAFHSYKLKGYKIEKLVDDAWIAESEVTLPEGENSFEFIPTSYTEQRRITWIYDEMNYYEDMGPVSFAKYLFANGYYTGDLGSNGKFIFQNEYHNLFNGESFTTAFIEESRLIASIYKAQKDEGIFPYVRASIPKKVLDNGYEFFITKYRPYALSLGGNENIRRPTAWTLQVTNTTSNGEYIEVDSQLGVSWENTAYNQKYRNYLEFNLETPVELCALQVTFKDSAAYQEHKDQDLNATEIRDVLDVGLMEFEVFVGVANPRGTMRVMTVLENIDQSEFSHKRESLVNESATITAPQYAVTNSKRYPCLGYKIETFNEETCTWIGSEIVNALSYEYTPDATKRERLTWVYDLTRPQVIVTFQGEGNENVSVNIAGVDGSFYAVGTTITVTANGNNDNLEQPNGETERYHSSFIRWVGDTDGLDIDLTSPSISFVVDRPRNLIPLFKRDWLCYETSGEWRIKDGNWDLCVSTPNSSSEIELNKEAYRSGAGSLDLSTPIYHYQTGKKLTMVRVNDYAMSKGNIPIAQITELILPKELLSIGMASFRSSGHRVNNAERFTLTNLVVNCPNLTTIESTAFTRQYNLHKVVLNIPNCKTFKGQYTFYAASFKDTNFEEWDLSGLTTICPNSFQHETGNGIGDAALYSSGVFRMPKLQGEIPAGSFIEARQATGYEFGTEKGQITKIGNQVFRGNAATNFVLGSLPSLTVSPTAFSNKVDYVIANFTFVNYAPDDRTQLDNILFDNTAETMANVYVSKIKTNWQRYVIPTENIKDETIKAKAQELGAWGAYNTKDDESGVWKAFVFDQSMPLDPKGTIFIVR